MFFFLLLSWVFVEKVQALTNSPLAIYYGGPVGTEYVVTSPLTYTKVLIDDNFANPQINKEYLFLGEGVMRANSVIFIKSNYL